MPWRCPCPAVPVPCLPKCRPPMPHCSALVLPQSSSFHSLSFFLLTPQEIIIPMANQLDGAAPSEAKGEDPELGDELGGDLVKENKNRIIV